LFDELQGLAMVLPARSAAERRAACCIRRCYSSEHGQRGYDVVVGEFVVLGADELGSLEKRSCVGESDGCLCPVALLGPAGLRRHRVGSS
jgi:hypothetical protein